MKYMLKEFVGDTSEWQGKDFPLVLTSDSS